MDISQYQHMNMNIRMSTRGKRPLRNLTPSDKVRAIQRIHNGETKASVSRDIGVPESTLRGWCKNEQKLRFMCRQLGESDQLGHISVLENPPEKRARFDSHIQTPKFSATTRFNEFNYRLPVNGISFNSSTSNSILDKIAFNEVLKKQIITTETIEEQSLSSNAKNQPKVSPLLSAIPFNANHSQISVMQNLNLLSLLNPNLMNISPTILNAAVNYSTKEEFKTKLCQQAGNIQLANDNIINSKDCSLVKHNSNSKNCNDNINAFNNTVSLSVKNWAKDPAEICTIDDEIAGFPLSHSTNGNNDSNNNNLIKNKCSTTDSSNAYNTPSHLPLDLLQIPNSITTNSDSENAALLEWCKIFNASLNFLALAAAAAALQPNSGKDEKIKSVEHHQENILYNELTKVGSASIDVDGTNCVIPTCDLSNDSYFDSEPEDLSVRSTTTSKLSSPVLSRSQSPTRSADSYSPLQSDGEL